MVSNKNIKQHIEPSGARSKKSPILSLIFRDKRVANHSIERLFEAMIPYFEKHYSVRKVVLQHQPSNLRAIVKNVWCAMRSTEGICHITGDAQYLAVFLNSKRTILTIHDCGYLKELRGLKKVIYKFLWFRLPCWRSGYITTISDSTKVVLEQELGVLDDKLYVIENCLTLNKLDRTKEFNVGCPQILQIGTGRHKNLDSLIQAVVGIDCRLKVVGKISKDDEIALKRHDISYSCEYSVSDARVREIYEESDMLFFASRHEGFGLPILEAQAAGIPVITSTTFSMPKVAGGAAVLVNPESVEEIRAAIQSIITDASLRKGLVENGIENIKRFEPEAIANGYLNLYARVGGR